MRRRPRSVRLAAVPLLAASLVAGMFAPEGPADALPATNAPVVQLLRVVPTSPFAGGRRSLLDNEGSAFVRRDRSLWIVDDDGELLIEMNVRTGKVKRTFDRDELAAVHREKRGKKHGKKAGKHRINDLEAVAYDRRKDQLFVFSGVCCSPSEKPTAFRLKRKRGKLRLDSYLPPPQGQRLHGRRVEPPEAPGVRRSRQHDLAVPLQAQGCRVAHLRPGPDRHHRDVVHR